MLANPAPAFVVVVSIFLRQSERKKNEETRMQINYLSFYIFFFLQFKTLNFPPQELSQLNVPCLIESMSFYYSWIGRYEFYFYAQAARFCTASTEQAKEWVSQIHDTRVWFSKKQSSRRRPVEIFEGPWYPLGPNSMRKWTRGFFSTRW